MHTRLTRELMRLEASLRATEVWKVRGRVRDPAIRCTQNASRTLSRCRNPAIEGTGLCQVHGGNAWGTQMGAAYVALELAVIEYVHLRAGR